MCKRILFVIGAIIMLTTSCQSNESEYIDDEFLINCWKHSREEDGSGLQVYRPCDYKEFPSSRYREEIILKKNDEVSYLVLAANDAHYLEDGTWSYCEKSKVIIIKNSEGENGISFDLIELSIDKMVVK